MKIISKISALIILLSLFMSLAILASVISCRQNQPQTATDPEKVEENTVEAIKGEEEAILTSPPNVPPPIKRNYPTKIIVNLEVIKRPEKLANGVEYTFSGPLAERCRGNSSGFAKETWWNFT